MSFSPNPVYLRCYIYNIEIIYNGHKKELAYFTSYLFFGGVDIDRHRAIID